MIRHREEFPEARRRRRQRWLGELAGLRRRNLDLDNHPDTLTTRASIAVLTLECGDAAAALHLLRDLLPDLEQVFGPGHPDTVATRHVLNRLAEETGPAAKS